MPANLKLRPRMQRLLSPAILQAEIIGIIAWLGVLLVDPSMKFDVHKLIVTLCLLVVCRLHRAVTHYYVWRLLGVAYMVLLAVGFAYVLHANLELQVFALPLALTLVLSSAVLFITPRDFLMCAALVWCVMWPNIQIGVYAGVEVYLFIFCLSSVSIGFILNFSYLKNLRSVLLVESEFRELAHTDHLTSLLNRRALWKVSPN